MTTAAPTGRGPSDAPAGPRGQRSLSGAVGRDGSDSDEALAQASAVVKGARRGGLVALTGAGISTDAGIPDFRGPEGVWTRDPSAERLSTLAAYLDDDQVRRRAWQGRLNSPVWSARPTRGHLALGELDTAGVLSLVITQNTDGLHSLAGHSPSHLVELHGTVHWTVCWTCSDRQPTANVLARVATGDGDPRCERHCGGGAGRCNGILKAATISFGQSLDRAVLERAVEGVWQADVLLAVGTTLEVQPAASLVPLARRAGASVVIVNGSPTALDHLADVVVRGPISDVLSVLADLSS